jgi:hypothetical protein
MGYTVPFETNYEYCEKNYQDYTPEAVSANGRGQLRAVFEIAYNHYVYRKGLSMPYTMEVLAAMGPEGAPFGADNPGYGSLFFFLSTSSNHNFNGLLNSNFTYSNDCWNAVTSGSTATVQSDRLQVTTVTQANGTKRGDIRRNGIVSLYPTTYPIVAVKMKKPTTCNFIFDTNLGTYGNGSNKWTGKVGDSIYYYNLTTTGFGSGNTMLSTTSPTTLTTFQFKVADISTGETSYPVEWVKTFKSLSDVSAYTGGRVATNTNPVVPEASVNNLAIYPNPVLNNRFYIKLDNALLNEAVQVKLFNMYGTLVFQKQFAGRPGAVEIMLDKPVASGVYMMQLNDRQPVKILIKK